MEDEPSAAEARVETRMEAGKTGVKTSKPWTETAMEPAKAPVKG
jgi:hypothetical protein